MREKITLPAEGAWRLRKKQNVTQPKLECNDTYWLFFNTGSGDTWHCTFGMPVFIDTLHSVHGEALSKSGMLLNKGGIQKCAEL